MSALFVVAYDVVNDRRRSRVARILLDFGVRVQYSVFECVLSDAQFSILRHLLDRVIDPVEDRVSFYSLCQPCRARRLHVGRPIPEPDPQFLIL